MSDEQAPATEKATTRPTSSGEAFQNAARVLRFAEGETDGRLFDQWTALAEKWMELGSIMGESDG